MHVFKSLGKTFSYKFVKKYISKGEMSFLKKHFLISKYKSENRDLYKMIKEEIYFYCINFESETNDADRDHCVYIPGIGV